MPSYRAVIFDLGDVLFAWDPNTTISSIPGPTLRAITQSPTWKQYERGAITADECYTHAAQEFGISRIELAAALQECVQALKPHETMNALINTLHAAGWPLYLLTNIGQADWERVRHKHHQDYAWGLFDGIFASGYHGMRKPDLGFYRYVLQQTRWAAHEVLFVDDRVENVVAARQVGMTAILFKSAEETSRTMKELLGVVC